jgi:hypothetical protein
VTCSQPLREGKGAMSATHQARRSYPEIAHEAVGAYENQLGAILPADVIQCHRIHFAQLRQQQQQQQQQQ